MRSSFSIISAVINNDKGEILTACMLNHHLSAIRDRRQNDKEKTRVQARHGGSYEFFIFLIYGLQWRRTDAGKKKRKKYRLI
jgi:hypothetical protein